MKNRNKLGEYVKGNTSNDSIYIDRENLTYLYWTKEFSIKEISKLLKCDYQIILRRMKRYAIPRRSLSTSIKINHFR